MDHGRNVCMGPLYFLVRCFSLQIGGDVSQTIFNILTAAFALAATLGFLFAVSAFSMKYFEWKLRQKEEK